MRITCPNCSTQYEVEENDISFSGQDVQCSECMTIWTQSRNGEATNPRMADDLVEDDSPVDVAEEVTEFSEDGEQEEIVSDLNFPDEPEEKPVHYDYPDVQEVVEEDTVADITEETVEETLEEEPTEAEPDTTAPVEPEPEIEERSKSQDDDIDEINEDDEEEDPIWKKIAELAQEASADVAQNSNDEDDYTPPDSIPPIQSAPVVPEDSEPTESVANENERPWEAAAEDEDEVFQISFGTTHPKRTMSLTKKSRRTTMNPSKQNRAIPNSHSSPIPRLVNWKTWTTTSLPQP